MLKSLSPPQGWRVGARRLAIHQILDLRNFKEPGREPASATARRPLLAAHAQPSRASETGVSGKDGRRAVEGSLCLMLYAVLRPPLRLLPVPAALRPGSARSRLAASWPLSPACGGAAWRGGFLASCLNRMLTSRTVSGLSPELDPDAETSSRTTGTDPSPVCRCARRLPMKGHRQGKGWWRAVDKLSKENARKTHFPGREPKQRIERILIRC